MLVDNRGEWKIPELSKPVSLAKQNPARSWDKFTLTPPPGMSCCYLTGEDLLIDGKALQMGGMCSSLLSTPFLPPHFWNIKRFLLFAFHVLINLGRSQQFSDKETWNSFQSTLATFKGVFPQMGMNNGNITFFSQLPYPLTTCKNCFDRDQQV